MGDGSEEVCGEEQVGPVGQTVSDFSRQGCLSGCFSTWTMKVFILGGNSRVSAAGLQLGVRLHLFS